MASHISDEAYDNLVERLKSDRDSSELYAEQVEGEPELVPVEAESEPQYQEDEKMAHSWPNESAEDAKYSEEHKAWHYEVMQQYK